jgi:hypothetical protein
MKLKYQLVLQFQGDSLDDYDAMIALEDDLIAELQGVAEVDGHDMGSGEANIFILTTDPRETFERAKHVLKRRDCLETTTAAYRATDGENYTMIWPEDSCDAFRIA